MKSFLSCHKVVISSALFAMFSSSSLLAANLTIPMSFEYLALNGEEIETNMFSHKSDLTLSNGTQKIAIRYHDMVEDDFSDSQSFVKSAPFIITLEVDGDHQYSLAPSKNGQATDIVEKPESFAKNPKVTILRKDKGTVNFKVEQTNYKESSFINTLFTGKTGHNVDALAAQATSTQTAAVTPTVQTSSATATVEAASTAVPAKQANPAQAEQMLQYWWLQADEKTRKEFMSWAIKQL